MDRGLVFDGQPLLCHDQVRIARAAEPDVAARILRLGAELREGFAGAFLGHVDGDAGVTLEIGGNGLAPLDLDRAIKIELTLGLRRTRENCRRDGKAGQPLERSHPWSSSGHLFVKVL